MMKLRLFAAGAVLLLMAGCASGPDVRGDFDPAADIGRFRTFGFVEQAGTDTGDARSLTTLLLQNAAGRAGGATVFAYRVRDPQRYGVVEFDAAGKAVGDSGCATGGCDSGCVAG